MGNKILLTPQEILGQSKNADTAANTLETLITDLNSMQENLKEIWQGEAADAFQSSCPLRIKELTATQETLKELSINLRNSVITIDAADISSKNLWYK